MSELTNLKILVVDDLSDMRMVLTMTLKRSGWSVLEAEDGGQAIALTIQELPDVILMDYNMPNMNGIDACREIKTNPKTRHIPILIYTGAYASDVRDAALEAGADQFLTKPLMPAQLRETVHNVIFPNQQALT